MRPLAYCLLLAATAVFGADEAKPKVVTAPPVERPLPSEKTKSPWPMVNLWWTMPETADFESLEIDVTISDDVDSSKLNLYTPPIGLGQLNDTNYYGGIQSKIGGNPVSDASAQGDYPKDSGPASPAIMPTELAEGGKEVVCKLHNEILTREKWAFPPIPAAPAK